MRVSAITLILVGVVLLRPHTLSAQHTPPTLEQVEAFAERARSQREVGKEASIPKKILKELVAANPSDDPGCDAGDGKNWEAHQFLLEANAPGGLAIQGRGQCFCSPTGNCDFWIYQLRNGRYRVILEIGTVQTFGFLKSRTHGYPDLVVWSHGSATDYGVRLFRFRGGRYAASGSWEEEYQYLDEHDQIVKPDKPRITPQFESGDELPQ